MAHEKDKFPRVPWELIERIVEFLWCDPLSAVDSIACRRDPKVSQLIGDIGLIWEQDPRLKAAIPDAVLDRDNTERWRLHRSISLVNSDWRALIRRLALRFAIIEHFEDWAAYCAFAGSSAFGSAQSLSTTDVGPQHLRFHASPLRWPPAHRWLQTCKEIAKLVPRCVSAEIIVTELDKDMVWIHKDWHRILRPLAELGTLKHLHIIWPPIQDARCYATFRSATDVMPFSRASSLTHCRLANLPPCVCSEGKHAHNPGCFVHALFCWMPHLRHLHIETPYEITSSFDDLRLKSLTVDVPAPMKWRVTDVEDLVWEYKLRAAIQRGFLKCPPGGAPRRLVVRTGREEMPGWEKFAEFCDTHGIDLEREMAFC